MARANTASARSPTATSAWPSKTSSSETSRSLTSKALVDCAVAFQKMLALGRERFPRFGHFLEHSPVLGIFRRDRHSPAVIRVLLIIFEPEHPRTPAAISVPRTANGKA